MMMRMNSGHSHEQQQQEQQQQQERQQERRLHRGRPKVLCLGVSFACMEQSAKRAGISLPQSVISSLANEQHAEPVATSGLSSTAATAKATTTTTYTTGGHHTSHSNVDSKSDSNERLPLESDNDDTDKSNDNDINDINQITAMVQECVQKNILTQMDGRDLVRCLATEHCCNVDVYTVSQECGALYRRQRHLNANFNRSNFVSKLQKHFLASTTTTTTTASGSSSSSRSNDCLLFDQIVLDYFWIPLGWDVEHWTRRFFSQVLCDLSKVLQDDGTGVIYLPFCCHCFKQVLVCRDILTRHYNISFVRKGTVEMNQIYLWQGTRQINPKIMQGVFGKRLDQEEIYCTFGPRNVNEDMEDVAISKSKVIDTCRQLEDFHDIRFIALRRIHVVDAAASPSSSSSSLPSVSCDSATRIQSPVAVAAPRIASSSSSASLSSSSSSAPAALSSEQPTLSLYNPVVPEQHQSQLMQVSRRILPLRACRQLGPEASSCSKPTTPFQSPPPPAPSADAAAAVKRALFPGNNKAKNSNKAGCSKKKHKIHNRGSILGLQDPRTVQRGFFSTPAAALTTSIMDNTISVVASTTTTSSSTTTRTTNTTTITTTRVVTPTPVMLNKYNQEHGNNGKNRKRSPLPAIFEDHDDEVDNKKPRHLF